jgi:hypothetical protein
MSTQVKFTNDGKIQMLQGGVLTDVLCPIMNLPCKAACINVAEPVEDQGAVYMFFNCGAGGRQVVVPSADFEDAR